MAQAFSELMINTRKSPLTLDAAESNGLRAGDRALNAEATLSFTSVRLYDLIYRGSWTLLAFNGSESTTDTAAVLKAINDLSEVVSTFILSTDSRIESKANVSMTSTKRPTGCTE